ncbi:MAG: hypothetical protein KUG83_09880 [Gammaproteobacteria bacterium]|nr:hypothetical protein [Gammaproteobacteria bacterium]
MLQSAPLLRIVKDELDATLQHAEIQLKAYSEGVGEALKECLDDFKQVSGACKMVKLPAAEMLAGELSALAIWMNGLPEDDSSRNSNISSLTVGIAMLGRYLNYIDTSESYSPELALPMINEVRLARGEQAHVDSLFFSFERDDKREALRLIVTKSAVELPGVKDLRRLRHMYQVGLLEVIRNNEGGFRLMKRALERVESICGDTAAAEVWPLAQASIDAMVIGDVELTRSRKLLFAWLDRDLKCLSVDGVKYLSSEPSAALVKELCYLIAVSQPASDIIKTAKQHLELPADTMSDVKLREERAVMLAPDASVVQAVSAAVNEELAKIKDVIDAHCRASDDNHHNEIVVLLEGIGQTLRLLELTHLCSDVDAQLQKLKALAEVSVEREVAYDPLVQLVLKIETVMSLLQRGGRLSDIVEDISSSGNASLGTLEEVRILSVVEARAGLALAKNSLSSYIDSDWDLLHLGNVPDSLHGVWGALYFLELHRAAQIVLHIQHYIEQRLLGGVSGLPAENNLETLADAVTSIDYYLESMEQNKPLGVGVLEVAEESLEVLGFAVNTLTESIE